MICAVQMKILSSLCGDAEQPCARENVACQSRVRTFSHFARAARENTHAQSRASVSRASTIARASTTRPSRRERRGQLSMRNPPTTPSTTPRRARARGAHLDRAGRDVPQVTQQSQHRGGARRGRRRHAPVAKCRSVDRERM